MHSARGLAYNIAGTWYDSDDIRFHLWGRERGAFPADHEPYRHTADYSLWR
jgi:hypothetical protein